MNTEQAHDELLPCPFCGCAMSLSAVARSWWRITGGHNEDCILYDHRHDAPQTDYQKQALIEDWNRRAALQSQSMPPEISRDLLGGIVDQVFGGAIEDTTVIEDIYRVIAREFALQSQDREDAFKDLPNGYVLEYDPLGLGPGPSWAAKQTGGKWFHFASSPRACVDAAIDHARRIEGEGE